MKKSFYTLALPLAALAMMALLPEMAFADSGGQADLAGSVTNAGTQIANIPGLISAIAYILGAAMIVAGAFKLRSHVENPLQEPIQKGVVRLAIGGVLVALPALIGWATKSVAAGSEGATFTPLDPVSVGGAG